MDSGEFGFYLGAAPGVIALVLNFLRIQKTIARAQKMAQENGEYLDLNFNPDAQQRLYFRPEEFIDPKDGPGVREGKKMLLIQRGSFISGHIKAGGIMVVGALVGSVLGGLISTP